MSNPNSIRSIFTYQPTELVDDIVSEREKGRDGGERGNDDLTATQKDVQNRAGTLYIYLTYFSTMA